MLNQIPHPSLPLFIGERREVVAAQLAHASWVASTEAIPFSPKESGRAQVGQIANYTPSLLNTPHVHVFGLIPFQNIVKLYGLRNDTCFPSKTL